jgi:hypothetical protein
MNPWLAALVVVAALAASAVGGWPLTAGVLRLAARSADAGRAVADPDAADAGGDGPTGPGARSVLRGGTWIGILERAAVTGLVLLGYPSGIAFVIAVKGLGRYPELREHPGASERFVIGSLASLIWAAVVGLGGAVLLR